MLCVYSYQTKHERAVRLYMLTNICLFTRVSRVVPFTLLLTCIYQLQAIETKRNARYIYIKYITYRKKRNIINICHKMSICYIRFIMSICYKRNITSICYIRNITSICYKRIIMSIYHICHIRPIYHKCRSIWFRLLQPICVAQPSIRIPAE